MDDQPFTAMDALRFGLEKFSEDSGYCFSFLFLIQLICVVAAGAFAFNAVAAAQLLFFLDGAPPESYFLAFIFGFLAIEKLAQFIINKWILSVHDGERINFNEFFGFDYGYHFPGMMRVAAAATVFNFYTVVGSVLLIVPGLFACSTLRFYKFMIIDRDTDAIQGLHDSFEISQAHKGQLILLSLITGAMKLIGLCIFGIGWIPACAVSGLAEAYAYRKLLNEYEHGQDADSGRA